MNKKKKEDLKKKSLLQHLRHIMLSSVSNVHAYYIASLHKVQIGTNPVHGVVSQGTGY
jgi:hypothetical protein